MAGKSLSHSRHLLMGADVALLFYNLHKLRAEVKYCVRKGQEGGWSNNTQYLLCFPGNSVLTTLAFFFPRQQSVEERRSVTWPLPDPRARSGLEQKLFPINPLRDCLIHPSPMPHGVLVPGICCCPTLGKQVRDFFPLVWRGSRTSTPIHSSTCCVIL